MLFRKSIWRLNKDQKCVYLTFDDGPIPEVTPWVLDLLDRYHIKATFFCVGDNVVRHPELYAELLRRGHRTGNHTMNHVQGIHYTPQAYLRNVEKAAQMIKSPLFRPPHGHLLPSQVSILNRKYKIIMWDVVTRDYSKLKTKEEVFENVKRYTRNGSIIVFHDSLKAEEKLRYALPLALDWLIEQGYEFRLF